MWIYVIGRSYENREHLKAWRDGALRWDRRFKRWKMDVEENDVESLTEEFDRDFEGRGVSLSLKSSGERPGDRKVRYEPCRMPQYEPTIGRRKSKKGQGRVGCSLRG